MKSKAIAIRDPEAADAEKGENIETDQDTERGQAELSKQEKKVRFIELKAKGESYNTIAKKLKVSKGTLSNWNRELEGEIARHRAMELESLYEQYYMTKEGRIKLLGDMMKKLRAEALSRDMSEMPTDKVFQLLLKYESALQDEHVPIRPLSDEEIGSLKGGDSRDVAHGLRNVLVRHRAGMINTEEAAEEMALLQAMLKAQEQAEVEVKLARIESVLTGKGKPIPTKRGTNRLLTKDMSAMELGRLVIGHCMELRSGKEGSLSDLDLYHVKQGLRTQEDRGIYNSMIKEYRVMSVILGDIKSIALHILLDVQRLRGLLQMYWWNCRISFTQGFMPIFMTLEQRRAARRKQKETRRKELVSLRTVLESRAYELATHEQQEECELDPGCLAEEHPELLERAAEQVRDLVRSGKLHPVRLQEADSEALDELEREIQPKGERRMERWREVFGSEGIVMGPQDEEFRKLDEEFDALNAKRDEYIRLKYDLGIQEELSPEMLLSERLEGIPLGGQVSGRILDHTFCSGKDLYGAELPEWVEWIDDTSLDLPNQLAIIEGPTTLLYRLHEDGYYEMDLSEFAPLFGPSTEDMAADSGDLMVEISQQLGIRVRVFLMYWGIVKAASQVMEVDFTEDLDRWYEMIEGELDAYNEAIRLEIEVEHDGRKLRYVRPGPMDSLEPIHLEQLRPDADTMKSLREELATSMGIDRTKKQR